MVEHVSTQRWCLYSFVNLSCHHEGREILIRERTLPVLISLSRRSDEELRRGFAAVILNLSLDVGHELALIQAGMVEALLVTSLVKSDQEDTRSLCAKALFNLLYDPAAPQKMVEMGVVTGFAAISRTNEQEVQLLCANAFCNLAYDCPAHLLFTTTSHFCGAVRCSKSNSTFLP